MQETRACTILRSTELIKLVLTRESSRSETKQFPNLDLSINFIQAQDYPRDKVLCQRTESTDNIGAKVRENELKIQDTGENELRRKAKSRWRATALKQNLYKGQKHRYQFLNFLMFKYCLLSGIHYTLNIQQCHPWLRVNQQRQISMNQNCHLLIETGQGRIWFKVIVLASGNLTPLPPFYVHPPKILLTMGEEMVY